METVYRNKRSTLLNFERKHRMCSLSYTSNAGKTFALEQLVKVSYNYGECNSSVCYSGLPFDDDSIYRKETFPTFLQISFR